MAYEWCFTSMDQNVYCKIAVYGYSIISNTVFKGALAFSFIDNIIRTIYETIIDFNFIEKKCLITVL